MPDNNRLLKFICEECIFIYYYYLSIGILFRTQSLNLHENILLQYSFILEQFVLYSLNNLSDTNT